MHALVRVTPVALCALAAPATLATFVPGAVTRTVMSGFPAPPIASSALGVFTQSQSGSTMGGGSQPQTIFGTASQDSNIDASLSPAITADLRVSGGSTGGSATNMTGTPTSTLTLTFQIVGSDTLVHTLVTVGGGVATLTPSGQSAINLFGAGGNNLALSAGTYTLLLQESQTAFGSISGSSFNSSIIGTISFVPAPAAGTLLGLAGLVGARRRRR